MNEKVGVVGAGLMGAEIALVFALAGHDVLLSDRGETELKEALERLPPVSDRGTVRGSSKADEKSSALVRIPTTFALPALAVPAFVTAAASRSQAVSAG